MWGWRLGAGAGIMEVSAYSAKLLRGLYSLQRAVGNLGVFEENCCGGCYSAGLERLSTNVLRAGRVCGQTGWRLGEAWVAMLASICVATTPEEGR